MFLTDEEKKLSSTDQGYDLWRLLSQMRQALFKDLDRKNLVRVALTEKGRKAYYQSTKRESIHNITSSLSEEECQQMLSYLKTLCDKALKGLGMERKMPLSS